MIAFDFTVTEKTTAVNRIIDAYFEESIASAGSISESYQQLWKELRSLLNSGGKRIRPKMTILSYEAFGGKDYKKILPIAAAQEFLHFSLLIHDDIIDRDYVRYGTANIAGCYDTRYQPFARNKQDRLHYANSAALLGGDLMLSTAYQMIATANVPNKDKIIAQTLLGQSIFEVAAGELLDTESAFIPSKSGDALLIARYKTASYSFLIPLLTGARLAAASEIQQKNLRVFAIALGIAYQLVDDLLGTFGEEELTGKSISSDIREGKHTFMAEQCIEHLSSDDRVIFNASFANPAATPEMIVRVKELFVATGAKAATEKAIASYAEEANNALQNLELDQPHKDAFEQLINKVTNRTS